MATANTERMWSRSKYPLHPSSQGSSPSSPTTSQSDVESLPSLAQLLDRSPAPWYHAVTASQQPQSQAQLGNDTTTDFSSLRLEGDGEHVDRSSINHSISRQSTSPPSVAPDYTHQHEAVAPSQGAPHDRHGTVDSDGHPAPSPEHELPPDQLSEQSLVQAPGRTPTLRRIPRDRRITSPISVEDIRPPRQPSDDDGSTVVSLSSPWKRHGYPLHSPGTDSTTQHPPPPPYQKESATIEEAADGPAPPAVHEETPAESGSRHQPLDHIEQASAAPTVSSPTMHAESITIDHNSPEAPEQDHQSQDIAAATQAPKKTLRRQAYPLQAPASVANLRHVSTPPQSESETESAEPTRVSEKPQEKSKPASTSIPAPAPVHASAPAPAPKMKSLRRRAYPLQSPVSIADLKGEVTPPPSPQSDHGSDSEFAHRALDDSPPSPSINRFRRHKYPLQSGARSLAEFGGVSGLQPKEASSQASEKPSQPAPKSVPSAPSASPAKHTSGRHAYPLQPQPIPAAAASSRSTDAPSAQHSGQIPRTLAEREAHKPIPEPEAPTKQVEKPAPQPKSLRRSKYPLQSPASRADLAEQADPQLPVSGSQKSKLAEQTSAGDAQKRSSETQSKKEATPQSGYPIQSVPAIQVESSDHDDLSNQDSREHKIATNVLKKWRRERYPLQSPKDLQPFERPNTPQPPGYEATKYEKPRKIHLPKNIRAVKDAEAETFRGRTIVVCLDGTGDKFDNDNSNIVHIVSALKKDDPRQVTYYQAGIGTYGDSGLTSGFAAAADMAVGSGLGLHVRDAYHFLMHTYKEGDKICIFGFSRGAYTARCLAGMIHKVGLLPPRNIQQIYFAYQFYTDTSKEGWIQSDMFKKTFSIDVNVYLLGCFDSVASVGFIPRQLPLSSTPTNKSYYFRHAMALDERRAKFKICRHQNAGWADDERPANEKDVAIEAVTRKAHQVLPNYKNQQDVPPGYHKPQRYGTNYHPNVTDEEWQELKSHGPPFETDVHEVWFAGAHADVGGGAVPNDERHKLAQIPLRWMIRQAFECNTGIIFKTKVLAEFGLDVHTLWPKYERLIAPEHAPPPSIMEKYQKELPPRHVRRDKLVPINKEVDGEPYYDLLSHKDEDWTPELVEDYYDAMSPLNDQLIQAPTWWILEFMPVEYKVPLAPGEVELRTGMNWGQYRGVEDLEPKMHWTVKQRMQNTNYKVLARTAKNTNWQVVV